MKRIKHRNLLPYFIDDERSLAKRRAYVASCVKDSFFGRASCVSLVHASVHVQPKPSMCNRNRCNCNR